ncbi:Uncharacterized protein BM_BM2535 [Brugia malayi]|uniref:Bm2535 n=1 Tax=Brugia malayi TaxID=6279 RepID=A0A0K0J6E6_BRUMA|nr:Uncharacterized protein BM_BM2535 [Brugia malayi]CRZ23841.1 Bm2535 [Brugia malayi]VIO86911.1 Uncharacterized protein BM_BM2535 [Brugia malayi]
MSPGKKKCQVTRKHYLKMLNKQNLERQLKLLYDANRKFHDTNDSLRKALDQKAILTSSPMRVLYDTSNAKPRETHSAYNTDENTVFIILIK